MKSVRHGPPKNTKDLHGHMMHDFFNIKNPLLAKYVIHFY